MSKNQNSLIDDLVADDEILENDQFEQEITDEDYGFIIGPDGVLKAFFMPSEYNGMPHSVSEILKAFGIDNPENVMVHTVH